MITTLAAKKNPQKKKNHGYYQPPLVVPQTPIKRNNNNKKRQFILQELGQEAHRLGRSLVRGPQIWWVLDTILYPQLGPGKRGGCLSEATGWRWREAPDGSATVVPTLQKLKKHKKEKKKKKKNQRPSWCGGSRRSEATNAVHESGHACGIRRSLYLSCILRRLPGNGDLLPRRARGRVHETDAQGTPLYHLIRHRYPHTLAHPRSIAGGLHRNRDRWSCFLLPAAEDVSLHHTDIPWFFRELRVAGGQPYFMDLVLYEGS